MTATTYLAILGRQPELGLVELQSLLGEANVAPFGEKATILSTAVDIDRLGGVVKLGEVLYRGPVTEVYKAPMDVLALARQDGKTTFGVSYYGAKLAPRTMLAAGLELKKRLRATGSVRLVSPTNGTELTAAQLLHNRILTEGFELLVVAYRGQMIVARTTAVQDIEAYAARDHGRPARSAVVGMLPPKLAQVLINTTASATVVDPFCGTGVILQEARLMGRSAIGFDLSGEMVEATRTNMTWLEGQVRAPLPDWRAEEADARSLKLPEGEFAIVSEGYLGPNLSSRPTPERIIELDREITVLYRDALANWAAQLPVGAELALCVPNWRTKAGWHTPALVDDLGKIGYTTKVFKPVPPPIRYARPDQIVGRQLLLLTRS